MVVVSSLLVGLLIYFRSLSRADVRQRRVAHPLAIWYTIYKARATDYT
jgi:hypothetical protein